MGDFYNGGTPGQVVPIGQYIADWYASLGAGLAVNPTMPNVVITMPIVGGIPAPIPQELQALTQSHGPSFYAWVNGGKVWPPVAKPFWWFWPWA